MQSFIICKNEGGETRLSCSESCTGWDHLSDLIESPGCSAGGSMQPWTNTYTYICQLKTVSSEIPWKSRSTWRDVNVILLGLGWLLFVFHSARCPFSVNASCKVDSSALPGMWIPGVGACEELSCIKHPQLLPDCCKPDISQQRFKRRAESGHLIQRLLAGPF